MPQPFVNPYYFSQYQQPQSNPYLQRMENLQQFQQTLNQPQVAPQMSLTNQPFTPLGKIVESVDIVRATDIPIDGSMYYFPKADGTEIYGKRWLPNGTTELITYKPILDTQNEQVNILSSEQEKLKFDTFTEVLEGIQGDIKTLTDKIDRLTKPTKAKKEVAEDE